MRKPSMLERMRTAVARAIAPAPAKGGSRAYSHARQTRTTVGFGTGGNASADAELHTGLQPLRARSRQMVRDSAYAKRAKLLVVNNVIGSGVGMQAQVMTSRDTLSERVNDDIERAWRAWSVADQCHTGGTLHFHDLERAAMGQVFEAGEVFIRVHAQKFGSSAVPMGLELVEAERIASEFVEPGVAQPGNEIRMGVEVDKFGRPQAYWIRDRHAGDIRSRVDGRTERFERVPADEVFHLHLTERWPQTRGEPWMHSILRKLDALAEYSQLEVDAARASAMLFATVENPEGQPPADGEDGGGLLQEMQPLAILGLESGEKLNLHDPSRPNVAFDPFVRSLLREIAAGTGTSYASLSCDYSQSNYSSSRLALLDDRDLWRSLQQWWIRSFRQPLHGQWLMKAVMARAIPAIPVEQFALDRAKFEAVLWKPRGWSWIDPTKEVAAYKEAIKSNLTTVTDVIAQTAGGQDIEDMVKTRRRELDLLKQHDIPSDLVTPEPAAAPAATPPEDEEDDMQTEPGARVVTLTARTA